MKATCHNCGRPFPLSIVPICPHCHVPETDAERADRIARDNAAYLHPSGKGPKHRAHHLWFQRPYEWLGHR